MADLTWNGVNGTHSTSTNWNPNGTPTNADTLRYLGNQFSDTDIDGASTGLNDIEAFVGPGFMGNIGTSGSPLIYGTGLDLRFNGKRCPSAYIGFSTGATIHVRNTKEGAANPLTLTQGTATSAIWDGGRTIVDGPTITAGYVNGNAKVEFTTNCTLTAVTMFAGEVFSDSAATTVTVRGGTWNQQGTTTPNITTLTIDGSSARGVITAHGTTITTLTVRNGGFLDLRELDEGTLTDVVLEDGAEALMDNGQDGAITVTNNITIRGRVKLKVPPSLTSKIVADRSFGTGLD